MRLLGGARGIAPLAQTGRGMRKGVGMRAKHGAVRGSAESRGIVAIIGVVVVVGLGLVPFGGVDILGGARHDPIFIAFAFVLFVLTARADVEGGLLVRGQRPCGGMEAAASLLERAADLQAGGDDFVVYTRERRGRGLGGELDPRF